MKNFFEDLKNLRWQNFVMLFIAGCINAFGVTAFLAPVKLYDSGISGTSILLSQISPEYMTLSVWLIILNVPLFLIGLKKQGAALMEAFECGTTKIDARGGYSNTEKTIIYFVVNRFQISKMRTIIHKIDPKAFVTISEVADVFKAND